MKIAKRKGLKNRFILPVFLFLFLINGFFVHGQAVYTPSYTPLFTVSNKPYAMAAQGPDGGRTYKADSINFIWRPFNGTSEVLTYFPVSIPKYRTGQFPIEVNIGGSLQSNGTFIGGQIFEYWWRNGTADSQLVLKAPINTTCSGCLLAANNLSDVANASLSLQNLGAGNMATQDIVATSTDVTGTWPSGLTVNSIQGHNLAYLLDYTNLTNKPAGLSLTTTGSSGVAAYNPTTGVLNIPNYATGGGGACLNCNADTLRNLYVDISANRNGWLLGLDTVDGIFKLYPPDTSGSGPGISSLNGLTTSTQTFATGTAGTDFGISSSGSTHAFNIPVASAINTGKLSSTDWSSFNSRLTGAGSVGSLFTTNVAGTTLQFTATASSANSVYVNNTGSTAVPTFGKLTIPVLANSTANTLIGFDGSGAPGNVALATTGTSGPATLSGLTLTIPEYQGQLTNRGSAFRLFDPVTNGIKSLSCTGCTLDSTTTGQIGITVTGGASIPPNIGSGFRIYSPQVPGFRSFFCSGCTIDSTTNTNGLTFTVTAGGSIGGSIAATQVAFGTAANTIGGNSAFTYNSTNHLLYSDSSSLLRLQTNAYLLNKIPFSAPSSLFIFGNSYDAGLRPCGGTTTYWTLSAATWGMSGSVTNDALSSTGVWYPVKEINQNYSTNVTSASLVGAIGFNVARSFPFSDQAVYNSTSGAYNAIFAAHFLGNFTVAGSGSSGVTTSGTWTNTNTGQWGGKGGATGGAYTTSNGAYKTFTATDSSMIVELIGIDTLGAKFQIYLDGALVLTSTTTGLGFLLNDGAGNNQSHQPVAIMFTGLSFQSHTLQVVNIDPSTNDTLFVDYFGRLRDASTATPLVLLKPNLLDTTGASPTGPFPYTNSVIRKMSRTMDSVFQTWNQNYPFYIIPTAIDTLNGICSVDHIHPNIHGDSAEWQRIISIVPSMTSAEPWSQYTQGTRRQNVNQNGWFRQVPAYDEVVKYGDEAKYFQNTPFQQYGSFLLNGAFQFQDGNQANGYVLTGDANGNVHWAPGGSGGTPAGTNRMVQFNNSGAFGADSNFTYNSSTGSLSLGFSAPTVFTGAGLTIHAPLTAAIDLNGHSAAEFWMRDSSQATNHQIYEVLNFQADFAISRLNNANSVRTYRLLVKDNGLAGIANLTSFNPLSTWHVNGSIRADDSLITPNIIYQTLDTSTYKLDVVNNSTGVHYKTNWPTFGGGSVSSVSNSDGTLTISPTTGSVVASLNTSNNTGITGLWSFNNAIRFPNSLGGNTMELINPNASAGTAILHFHPSDGTNTAANLYVYPKGTPSGTTAEYALIGTDYAADQTNFHYSVWNFDGTNYNIGSGNAGTSALHALTLFTGTNTNQLKLNTDGSLLMSGQLTLPAATTGAASLLLASSAGTNPSSPSSGQLWWNGTNLDFRTGSTTVDLLAGGGGAVSSVANSDGTLTISPTTGSVIASLALGHANTWSALQTFGTLTTTGVTKFTGIASGATTDSVLTINPSTGQVTWRSSAFSLFVANGLTAAAGDSIYWGGTLNQPTSIVGAGFTLSEGTSGSPLGAYSVFASGMTLTTAGGNMTYSGTGVRNSTLASSNANITLGSGTNAMTVELGTITASRTVTLSSPATGQTYEIDNISQSGGGSGTNKWTFATTVLDFYANTVTNIPYGRSKIFYNGSGWILAERPNVVQSIDVTGATTGNGLTQINTIPCDAQYRIGGYITITAVTGTTVSMSVSYTDETNTSRTASLIPVGLTSGVVSTTGVFNMADMTIKAKGGTSISMQTTVTGVSITYDAGCSMTQIN